MNTVEMDEFLEKSYVAAQSRMNEFLEKQLKDCTKIKEPYTTTKLRYHGIKLCSAQRIGDGHMFCTEYWLEQRGVQIGSKYPQYSLKVK